MIVRIPTVPGWSTSRYHRLGRHYLCTGGRGGARAVGCASVTERPSLNLNHTPPVAGAQKGHYVIITSSDVR